MDNNSIYHPQFNYISHEQDQYPYDSSSQYLPLQRQACNQDNTVNAVQHDLGSTEPYNSSWQHDDLAEIFPEHGVLQLDLEHVTADPTAVAAMDISDLTTGLHDGPWQPNALPPLGHSDPRRTVSDPSRFEDLCEEMGVNRECSDMIDSGFSSMQPSPAMAPPMAHLLQRAQSQQNGTFQTPLPVPSILKRSKSTKSGITKPAKPPSSVGSRRRSVWVEVKCDWPNCTKVLKSRSEQTKHIKTHTKPHKCHFLDCPKATDGFGTPNDWKRHLRFKHNYILPGTKEDGYACRYCPSVDGMWKWWPRKDNFSAHVTRKHKDYTLEEVLDACYKETRPDDTVSENGTAISGLPSNYYSQSHPDSESQYQYEHNSPTMLQPMNMFHNQPQFQETSLLAHVNPVDPMQSMFFDSSTMPPPPNRHHLQHHHSH